MALSIQCWAWPRWIWLFLARLTDVIQPRLTLGLDFAYRTLDGAVLFSKKIQSIGRGEVEVSEASCEVKGLDTIAYEAMDLVTDGMALQLGTSSKINEAAHAHKDDGSQAVSLPSSAAASVSIPVDQPATVIFRAIVRDENRDQVFHSGEAIAIEIEVKNEGPGTARAVELLVAATPILTKQIPGVVSIGDLKPGEVKHVTLDGKVGTINAAAQEELTLILRAKSPLVRLPSAKKFLVAMNPASTVDTATPVDVDRLQNGPACSNSRKPSALSSGWGSFGRTAFPGSSMPHEMRKPWPRTSNRSEGFLPSVYALWWTPMPSRAI